MSVSVVSPHRCQLFCVEVVDLMTYDSYRYDTSPSTYLHTYQLCRELQDMNDPDYQRFEYRISMCS